LVLLSSSLVTSLAVRKAVAPRWRLKSGPKWCYSYRAI
jgi:hypothetical protein